MAVYSKLPATDLQGADIRDTINSYGGAASNVWATFFDSTGDVNKWSKWKPFIYAADFVEEDILIAQHCGLTISHFSNWGLLTTKYSEQYVYNKPTGGSTQPFRGGDWRNYTKDAVCFFNRWEAEDTICYAGNNLAFTTWFNSPPTGSIQLSDIVVNGVKASNCYAGYIAVKSGTSNYYVITDTATAGSGVQFGALITFSTAYETWTVYPMLSSTKFETLTLNPTNPTCLLSLPDATPVTISVRPVSEMYQIAINACTVTEGVGRITVAMDIWMSNKGASARTFTIQYQVVGWKGTTSTTLRSYYQILSQSVAAGTETTKSVSNTFTSTTGYDYYIVYIKDVNTGYETNWDTSYH